MGENSTLLETKKFRVARIERTYGGQRHTREVVVHPGAAVILPVLPDDRILLTSNYRPAVDKVLLELPAGTRDPGEDAATCARRELAEETGYRAGRLEPLLHFYASPGILTERLDVFIATELTPGAADLDEGEQIEPAPLSLAEALAAVRDGRIEDVKTIATLLFYERFSRGTKDRA